MRAGGRSSPTHPPTLDGRPEVDELVHALVRQQHVLQLQGHDNNHRD